MKGADTVLGKRFSFPLAFISCVLTIPFVFSLLPFFSSFPSSSSSGLGSSYLRAIKKAIDEVSIIFSWSCFYKM